MTSYQVSFEAYIFIDLSISWSILDKNICKKVTILQVQSTTLNTLIYLVVSLSFTSKIMKTFSSLNVAVVLSSHNTCMLNKWYIKASHLIYVMKYLKSQLQKKKQQFSRTESSCYKSFYYLFCLDCHQTGEGLGALGDQFITGNNGLTAHHSPRMTL